MQKLILALALHAAAAFAPVSTRANRAPVELEAKKSVAELTDAELKGEEPGGTFQASWCLRDGRASGVAAGPRG